MFEGFEERLIEGAGADIFCRVAGEGPPLLLLHGYPQTGAIWARIAPELAQEFTLVVADLRGYGHSSKPASRHGQAYTKRAMAADMVAVMAALGHERFALAGHDRGGRVGYRLALDRPDTLTRLAVLDIVPTAEMWAKLTPASAIVAYHWQFLARPEPLPERLIGAEPDFYLDTKLSSMTATGDLSPFAAEALAEYRAAFRDRETIHATCEDYRAGATLDREHDDADRAAGRRIVVPLLALWGTGGLPSRNADVLSTWRDWAETVEGREVPGGHYCPEEAPAETLAAMRGFFGRP